MAVIVTTMDKPRNCDECGIVIPSVKQLCKSQGCPLKELPSGKWVFKKTENPYITVRVGRCSECGFTHDFLYNHTAQYKYCPNCGAKMEQTGEQE